MTDDLDTQTIDTDLTDDAEATDENAPVEETEAADEPTEEVELDGKKYAIPAALKDKFLMQQDYARKTQEVAELRKAAEHERAAIRQAVEADEQASELKSDLRTVDKALKQFENVDWGRFAAEAPAQAQAAMMQYQQLQMQRQQLADGLTKHEQTSRQAREQAQQAALAQAHAELLQAMPDFNHDLAVKIRDSTVSAYGYTPEEMATITDPRQVRILRDAMMWRESQAKLKTAQQPTPAKPVTTVKPSSKPTVNPDKMTTAEWMDYERKRMKTRR